MRVPSSATATTLAPRSTASSVPVGDSFVGLLNAATVKWYPVQQASGSAAHESSEGQEKSNRKTAHAGGTQPSISRGTSEPDSTSSIPQMVEVKTLTADRPQGQANDQDAGDGSLANEKLTTTEIGRAGSDTNAGVHPRGTPGDALIDPNKRSPDLSADGLIDAPDEEELAGASGPNEMQSITNASAPAVEAAALSQPLQFSMLNTVADKQSGLRTAGDPTQKASLSAMTSSNQDAAGAAGSGAGKASDATNGVGGSPNHSAQGTPSDSIQSSVATQRVMDNASSHSSAQTVVSLSVPSQATSAPRMGSTSAETSHLGGQRQVADPMDADSAPVLTTSAISDARLMQTMNESQMRIGLSSNAFGDISIRTSISGHQLVAQISLDHGELSQAMTAQISSVQTKLQNEHGLQASIEINNHASSQSGDTGSSSQRERGSPTAPLRTSSAIGLGEEGSGLSQETILNAANETRLDIRA